MDRLAKSGDLNFYNVEVNGRAMNNVISVLPPTSENPFWKIEMENKRTILASGNVWIEYGPGPKTDYSVSPKP